MEEMKNTWKKKSSWLLGAIVVVIIYKLLDNFSGIQEWFSTLFSILKPFLIGLLIAYILFIPCKKIEKFFEKSKLKIISKKSRGLSVIITYILFVLLIIIVIKCIFPILQESIVELIDNIPEYYNRIVQEYNNLPDDSILKNDIISEKFEEFKNINVNEIISNNSDKILGYIKNIINVFSGIFDVFVSIVVSVYILLQRTAIMKSLRRFARAIFKQDTYEVVDKYFTKGNTVFFTFISSQLLDAIIIGIMTTIAMLIMKVKYAPLLGFIIGLFNMVPYFGAIIAVGIAIIITFITGGLTQCLIMAVVVIILQQIDANIINPKIIGASLETSPLLVIFSITIGGAYFGVIGMLLAVPIAIVIKTIMIDFVDSRNKIRDEEIKNKDI